MKDHQIKATIKSYAHLSLDVEKQIIGLGVGAGSFAAKVEYKVKK